MGTLGGLSEAEARIAELEAELAAAVQARDYERDGWLLCTKMRLEAEQARDKYLALWRETALMVREARRERDAAEARATRLAALEEAARALVYGGRPVIFGVQAIHEALEAPAPAPATAEREG